MKIALIASAIGAKSRLQRQRANEPSAEGLRAGAS